MQSVLFTSSPYANLNNASTLSLLQTNHSCLDGGGGLIQHPNGVIEMIPKSPAFVFGERVVRPAIDASMTSFKYAWEVMNLGFSSLNGVFKRIFNPIPGAQAVQQVEKNISDQSLHQKVTHVIKNETCPLMATWLSFIDLMCKNQGGGITITPMRSHHMNPQRGIVVALRGFSKIVPALEFCSSGRIIVEQYVEKNSDLLSESVLSEIKTLQTYLGAWYDSDHIKVYLDISVVFNEEDVDKAIAFAKEQNQIAAYHISEGREVLTGGTGEN